MVQLLGTKESEEVVIRRVSRRLTTFLTNAENRFKTELDAAEGIADFASSLSSPQFPEAGTATYNIEDTVPRGGMPPADLRSTQQIPLSPAFAEKLGEASRLAQIAANAQLAADAQVAADEVPRPPSRPPSRPPLPPQKAHASHSPQTPPVPRADTPQFPTIDASGSFSHVDHTQIKTPPGPAPHAVPLHTPHVKSRQTPPPPSAPSYVPPQNDAPRSSYIAAALEEADASKTPSAPENIPRPNWDPFEGTHTQATDGTRRNEAYSETPASQIFVHSPAPGTMGVGSSFFLHPAFYVTLLVTAALLLFAYHFVYGQEFRP